MGKFRPEELSYLRNLAKRGKTYRVGGAGLLKLRNRGLVTCGEIYVSAGHKVRDYTITEAGRLALDFSPASSDEG